MCGPWCGLVSTLGRWPVLILLTLLRQWSPRSVPLRPFIPAMITLPLTQMSSPPLPPPSSVMPSPRARGSRSMCTPRTRTRNARTKPFPPPPRARVRTCPQADKLSANIDKHEGKIVKQNVAKKKLEVHMNDHPVDNKMRLTQKAAVRKAKKASPYEG